jgi:DNA-binding transcriptional ArsR family regulator
MSKRSYTQLQALAETFKVLGDTTRVRILDALSQAEVPVCDLAELLDLTQSAVSHQLRLLRGARLVKSRRDGQHIYYTLDDQHIVKLFEQGLEHIQERTMPGHVGADLRVPPPRGYGEARQSAKRDGGRPGPTHGSAPTRRARRA